MSDSELLPGENRPEEAPPAKAPAVPKKRKASMFDDPMVRMMAWIAGGLVVLYAAGMIAAVFFGVIGSPAPRTAMERDIYTNEAAINEGSKDPVIWAEYVAALMRDGQLAKAQVFIDRGLKTVDQSRGADLTIQQARLYILKKDYQSAIKTVDEALAIIQKKYDFEMTKKDPTESRAFGLDKNYYEAVLIKAGAYRALGDNANALTAFSLYLKNNSGDVDVLIDRARLRVKMGDKAGAITDYKAALSFIPDDKRALTELQQIGASK